MSLFDRLFGTDKDAPVKGAAEGDADATARGSASDEDEAAAALERDSGRVSRPAPEPERRMARRILDVSEILVALQTALEHIDARLDGVSKLDGVVGMVQAMARTLSRSDQERAKQFLDLRGHITQEFDRLGAQLRLDAGKQAAVDVFKAIAPGLDDVSHVIRESAGDEGKGVQSLKMIERKMKDAFARLGIEEIPIEEGKTQFDGSLHEAWPYEGDAEKVKGMAPGTIVRVERAGYRSGEVPVRVARVVVVAES